MANAVLVLTAATWYHVPVVAIVVLITVVGTTGVRPFTVPPPKPNQKWLSSCLRSRQPSVLMPLGDILSTIDMSPARSVPGGWPRALKWTQASTLKSPAETCRFGAFPALIEASTPV